MTQASKRDIAKHKILDTLQKSPDGLRFNELHKRCEKVIVSNSTFGKYIDEMKLYDHTVVSTPDPQDPHRAVLIKATPESSKPAFALLEALAEIEKVASGREVLRKSELMAFEGLDIDRKDLSKNESKAYVIQMKRIEDLFTIAYKLVCEQHRKGDWKAGEVYLRAFNAKGGALDGMRGLGGITVADLERLRYESAVLAHIFIFAKRHPELEKVLEEAIPGIVKIMTEIFAASLGISPQTLDFTKKPFR
jgi:hypothetical protein